MVCGVLRNLSCSPAHGKLIQSLYGGREVKNIQKGASWGRHWSATAGLLRAIGSSCAVCQDSTIGPLANLSSLTMAAAVFANSTKFVQGLIKLGEEVTE